VLRDAPQAVVARGGASSHVLFDAMWSKDFGVTILETIARRRRLKGATGEVVATRFRAFGRTDETDLPAPRLIAGEHSNTSMIYGDRFILKLFRRIERGINPELEIGRFLTERGFAHAPAVAGALEYHAADGDPLTLSVLHSLVPNEGDGRRHALDFLRAYLDEAVTRRPDLAAPAAPHGGLVALADQAPPALALEMMAPYLEAARRLGTRTAELHLALASDSDDPAFAPEPFSVLHQRSVYQSLRTLTRRTLLILRQQSGGLPETQRAAARRVQDLEPEILRRFKEVLARRLTGMRIRCHGDYHLAQVLHTGKDFVVIDFEGESLRSIGERRIKRSPLSDVAGMLRSFHHVARTAAAQLETSAGYPPEVSARLVPWARFWQTWAGAVFLASYLAIASGGRFLPHTRPELAALLDVYLLEKTVREIGRELSNRPPWLEIPFEGILQLMEPQGRIT
jgi:maltose alpha-D-glucosyltransferase/alpha-amylase